MLHPCAEDLEIFVPEVGRVIASAKTSTVGPGYHVFLCELLQRFGKEMSVRWDGPSEDGDTGDETGYFHTGDASVVEREMFRWLRSVASIVIDKLEQDGSAFMVSMPLGHGYPHETGIVTPTGPRDLDWFRRAAADPESCTDFFPWWGPERDAQFYLGRALCQMWKDVRWRCPLFDDERDLLVSVARDLERAWTADPHVSYPWREWNELLGYLAEYDDGQSARRFDDLGAEIARRAADTRGGRLIGYRRRSVRVDLAGGWSLEIPGEMAEAWDDDGETWSAWDGWRTIWFSSYSVPGADQTPRSAEELPESARPDRLEGDVIRHGNGELIGVATIGPHEEDGEPMWALKGTSALPGEVGVCSVFFVDDEDREWAIETWKSLKGPAAANRG